MKNFFAKNKIAIIAVILSTSLISTVSVFADEIAKVFKTVPVENVEYLENALDKLLMLKPATFSSEMDKSLPDAYGVRKDYGFLVDDVESVFPDWIITDEDGYKRVYYGLNVSLTTISAIQELYNRLHGGEMDIAGNTITGNTICVEDVCITKDEFKALLASANIQSVSPSTSVPVVEESAVSETPTPEPQPEPEVVPEEETPVVEEPVVSETPTPEPQPEPEVVPEETPVVEEPVVSETPTPEPQPEPEATE